MTTAFGIVTLTVASVVAVALAGRAILSDRTISASTAIVPVALEQRFLSDEWNARISSETFWRARPNRPSTTAPSRNGRSNLQGPPPVPAASQNNSWFLIPPSNNMWADPEPQRYAPQPQRRSFASGIRTVCVRSCDGSFFPISFSGSEANFSRDQTACSNACPGSKLYYYRSNEDPTDMVDLAGQPYSKSPNANLFRTQYVENCKCKPHPWEQQAMDRHRIYALEDQRRKGNRAVVAELTELKAKTATAKASETRRSRDRSRRKDRPVEETAPRASAAAVSAAAQVAAPRSDASRGQSPGPSGDRPGSNWGVHLEPTGEAIPTAVASAAAGALSPSQSPIARAAQAATQAASQAPSQPSATAGSDPSRQNPSITPAAIQPGSPAAPYDAASARPGEVPHTIQPDAMPAPEAIIAVPFEQAPEAANEPAVVETRPQTRSARRSRSQERANRRTADSGPPTWQINRSSSNWTRSVFGQ